MAIGGVRCPVRLHLTSTLARTVTAISAILLFGGGPALGSSLAAAGSVLYVPAGAHTIGQNGANWRTDVEVHNPGSDSASFTMALLVQNADNSSPQTRTFTLGPQQSTRYADVLSSVFGVEGAAALRFTVTAGTILVTSRTYNLIGVNPWGLPVGASFGQFVPGFVDTDAIGYGEEGRLIQLTQQAASTLDGFRTNVGIVNTTGIPIDVRIDLYRSDGTLLGTKSGSDTNLPPYGFRQLNQILNAWGTVTDGYAIVKTTTPSGGLFAFASVNDNHNSGDPIFVPAVKLSGPGPTMPQVYLPASAHAAGRNGANWRTDAEVHNPGTTTATFTIELLMQDADNGGSVPSRSVSLGPQQTVRYVDILSTLFGTTGAAALRFTTQSGTILVNSRTYNLIGANDVGLPVGASFGQFVPALSVENAIAAGDEGRLVQLTQRDSTSLSDFRSNVGIVNATGQTIEVQIDLYGSDGSLLGTVKGDDTRLLPYEFRQINNILGKVTSWCADGYAIVKTTTAGGSLFAFASVVDNHLTGDPIFIPAVRIAGSGSSIYLFPPSLTAPLLSSQRTLLQVPRVYHGELGVTFKLESGPTGMTMSSSTGVLIWTPPASAEGTSAHVTVSATDGQVTAQTSFSLPVATTQPIATSLTGSTLTVTSPGSLQGISFTFPANASPPPAQIGISIVPVSSPPDLPTGVRRLTDLFRLTPVSSPDQSWITVSLPPRLVPAGSLPQDLRLYLWQDEVTIDGGTGWLEEWYDLDVLANGTVTLKAGPLGGLCFVGLAAPAMTTLRSAPVSPLAARFDATPPYPTWGCSPRPLSNGGSARSRYVCTVTGAAAFTVEITGNIDSEIIAEELMNYLIPAREKLDALRLVSDPRFGIVLEDLSKWGIVSSVSRWDNYAVLHIDQGVPYSGPRIHDEESSALAHALFQHAAARTKQPPNENVLLTREDHEADWIVNGLARWFEDEVYDDLNSYKWYEKYPPGFPPILRVGLGAIPFGDLPLTNANRRWAFWKAVSNYCRHFSVPQALNAPPGGDSAGLQNVGELIADFWDCRFVTSSIPKLDPVSWGLGSALQFFSFVTQVARDISLLDPNEKDFDFQPPSVRLQPSVLCHSLAQCPSSAHLSSTLFPAGAFSFVVASPGADLEPDGTLALQLQSTRPVFVWIWSLPAGDNKDGHFLQVQAPSSYSYGASSGSGALLVMVVNPSATDRTFVNAISQINNPGSCSGQWSDSLSGYIGALKQGSSYPVWTGTSQGSASGPQGFSITASWNAGTYDPATCTYMVTGIGGTPPYQIVGKGSLQAVPDQLSGSVTNTNNVILSWIYSNPRLQVDYPTGPVSSGPDFSFALPVAATSFRKEVKVCVLYDEVAWLTLNGKEIERDTMLAAPKACVYFEFNLTPP